MKKILLLAGSSSDSNLIVADAALMTGRSLCQVANSRRAFELLQSGVHDYDLVIVDLDSEFHPMAILEGMAACRNLPSVIVLTGFEEEYMDKVAREHGAAACIGKPFQAARLASLIGELLRSEDPVPISCDLWGHPKGRSHLQKQPA